MENEWLVRIYNKPEEYTPYQALVKYSPKEHDETIMAIVWHETNCKFYAYRVYYDKGVLYQSVDYSLEFDVTHFRPLENKSWYEKD